MADLSLSSMCFLTQSSHLASSYLYHDQQLQCLAKQTLNLSENVPKMLETMDLSLFRIFSYTQASLLTYQTLRVHN